MQCHYGYTRNPVLLDPDAPGEQAPRLCLAQSLSSSLCAPGNIHHALPLPLERVRYVGLVLVDRPVDLPDREHLHRLRHRNGREPVFGHAVRAAVQRGSLHGPVAPAVDGGLQLAGGLVQRQNDVVGPPVCAECEGGDLRGWVDGQVRGDLVSWRECQSRLRFKVRCPAPYQSCQSPA